ncbi:unnamed protein product [Amoebophrya sp. A120]|nr:unnamed protein product [Amoebophrya sp. A120]|eukprot:GSA120T00025962001.1
MSDAQRDQAPLLPNGPQEDTNAGMQRPTTPASRDDAGSLLQPVQQSDPVAATTAPSAPGNPEEPSSRAGNAQQELEEHDAQLQVAAGRSVAQLGETILEERQNPIPSRHITSHEPVGLQTPVLNAAVVGSQSQPSRQPLEQETTADVQDPSSLFQHGIAIQPSDLRIGMEHSQASHLRTGTALLGGSVHSEGAQRSGDAGPGMMHTTAGSTSLLETNVNTTSPSNKLRTGKSQSGNVHIAQSSSVGSQPSNVYLAQSSSRQTGGGSRPSNVGFAQSSSLQSRVGSQPSNVYVAQSSHPRTGGTESRNAQVNISVQSRAAPGAQLQKTTNLVQNSGSSQPNMDAALHQPTLPPATASNIDPAQGHDSAVQRGAQRPPLAQQERASQPINHPRRSELRSENSSHDTFPVRGLFAATSASSHAPTATSTGNELFAPPSAGVFPHAGASSSRQPSSATQATASASDNRFAPTSRSAGVQNFSSQYAGKTQTGGSQPSNVGTARPRRSPPTGATGLLVDRTHDEAAAAQIGESRPPRVTGHFNRLQARIRRLGGTVTDGGSQPSSAQPGTSSSSSSVPSQPAQPGHSQPSLLGANAQGQHSKAVAPAVADQEINIPYPDFEQFFDTELTRARNERRSSMQSLSERSPGGTCDAAYVEGLERQVENLKWDIENTTKTARAMCVADVIKIWRSNLAGN